MKTACFKELDEDWEAAILNPPPEEVDEDSEDDDAPAFHFLTAPSSRPYMNYIYVGISNPNFFVALFFTICALINYYKPCLSSLYLH